MFIYDATNMPEMFCFSNNFSNYVLIVLSIVYLRCNEYAGNLGFLSHHAQKLHSFEYGRNNLCYLHSNRLLVFHVFQLPAGGGLLFHDIFCDFFLLKWRLLRG